MKSFSHGVYSQSYYSCNKEGEAPVLIQCPNNEVYWAVKEKCSAKIVKNGNSGRDSDIRTYADDVMDKEKRYRGVQLHSLDLQPFSEPVLGRSVYLGCLFDAKRNDILSEYSLWKEETIMKNKRTSSSLTSTLKVFSAQTTFERLAHTDYPDSLKLDFLGKFKY